MKRLILLLPAAGLIWFLLPTRVGVWNIGNQLGTVLCLFLLLWGLFLPKLKQSAEKAGLAVKLRLANRVLLALLCAGFLWVAALSVQMLLAMNAAPPANTTTVVVLGSQVKGTQPSLDLWERIHTAERYLKENPQAVCIASGGQGDGEQLTEAAVIRDKLVEAGISPSRILLEDQSRSTEQNLQFSARLIQQQGLNPSVAIVTDEYHQLRASWLAKEQGLTPYAVSAVTIWYILPAMYARELLALTAALLPL